MAELIQQEFPNRADFINSLGVANYRNGEFAQSIDALKRSATRRQEEESLPDGHPSDLGFLTLATLKLGQLEHAREYYSRFENSMDSEKFRNSANSAIIAEQVRKEFGKVTGHRLPPGEAD